MRRTSVTVPLRSSGVLSLTLRNMPSAAITTKTKRTPARTAMLTPLAQHAAVHVRRGGTRTLYCATSGCRIAPV